MGSVMGGFLRDFLFAGEAVMLQNSVGLEVLETRRSFADPAERGPRVSS